MQVLQGQLVARNVELQGGCAARQAGQQLIDCRPRIASQLLASCTGGPHIQIQGLQVVEAGEWREVVGWVEPRKGAEVEEAQGSQGCELHVHRRDGN